MSVTVPDLTEPVLAFRSWRDDRLQSLAVEYRWPVGVVTAECKLSSGWPYAAPPRHTAPGHGCSCGLHGYYSPESCPQSGALVIGAVALWGALELHNNLARAQFAEVIALTPNGERAAHARGIKTVDAADLADFASSYGKLIPREMLPEPTPGSELLPRWHSGVSRTTQVNYRAQFNYRLSWRGSTSSTSASWRSWNG